MRRPWGALSSSFMPMAPSLSMRHEKRAQSRPWHGFVAPYMSFSLMAVRWASISASPRDRKRPPSVTNPTSRSDPLKSDESTCQPIRGREGKGSKVRRKTGEIGGKGGGGEAHVLKAHNGGLHSLIIVRVRNSRNLLREEKGKERQNEVGCERIVTRGRFLRAKLGEAKRRQGGATEASLGRLFGIVSVCVFVLFRTFFRASC